MRSSQDEPTCIMYAKDVDDENNAEFEMVSNIDGEIELQEIEEFDSSGCTLNDLFLGLTEGGLE